MQPDKGYMLSGYVALFDACRKRIYATLLCINICGNIRFFLTQEV